MIHEDMTSQCAAQNGPRRIFLNDNLKYILLIFNTYPFGKNWSEECKCKNPGCNAGELPEKLEEGPDQSDVVLVIKGVPFNKQKTWYSDKFNQIDGNIR